MENILCCAVMLSIMLNNVGIITAMPLPYSIMPFLFNPSALLSHLACGICEDTFDRLQELVSTDAAQEDIVRIAIEVCIDVRIEHRTICESIIPLYKVSPSKQ